MKVEEFESAVSKPKHNLSDTVFIFKDDEVLVNCMRNNKGWYVGDVLNNMRVPEHCHIAKVDAAVHNTEVIDGLISGGFMHGAVQQVAFGFCFNVEQVNCVDTINCEINTFLPMQLTRRYMHQSCIVRNKNGSWSLLLVGGKQTINSWLNTVESIDLLPFFKPGLTKKVNGLHEKVTSNWTVCSSMTSARANFALQVIKNTVYVFGGIEGMSQSGEAWKPSLAQTTIEKYLPQEDIWMTVTIPNTPQLAAFSWCATPESLIVLGGSDGNLLNSELFVISFVDGTCQLKATDFEFSTGMGHLILRAKEKELVHFGGFNSYGVNYSLPLGGKNWKALTGSHSHVLGENELELTNNTSVYY